MEWMNDPPETVIAKAKAAMDELKAGPPVIVRFECSPAYLEELKQDLELRSASCILDAIPIEPNRASGCVAIMSDGTERDVGRRKCG